MSRRNATLALAAALAIIAASGTLDAQGRVLPVPKSSFNAAPSTTPVPRRPQPRIFPYQGYWGGYSPYLPYLPYVTYPTYFSPVATQPADTSPAVQRKNQELLSEVQRLTREVEQIRKEQNEQAIVLPPFPVPPPQAAAKAAAKSKVLVFRDGHRLAFENYALTGRAVWILDDGGPAQVPLSELDLDATEQQNRGTNLKFPRPSTK